MNRIRQLTDVVKWRLCLGCGACAYICPEDRIRLMDFSHEGIRPVVNMADCGSCRKCLDVCPAVRSDFRANGAQTTNVAPNSFRKEWGPIAAIWEGYATDPQIRFCGSSGGVLTAIGAYCIEVLGMHGVLHIAQDPDDPLRNRTRLSRTREELYVSSGSRYSPASVCNSLGFVEKAPAPCAVIGRPAEISAVSNARRINADLDRNVGVTLSFFCAESPSTKGTIALLEKMGIDPASVTSLRYRGNGWPGHFSPTIRGKESPPATMTYQESWAFLQSFRPWSVQLWPDGTGELADISCGDPWYEKPDGQNPGFSLVVARTDRGREIIEGAIRGGYLSLKPADNWKLIESQSGLLVKKGAIWGRSLAMRLFCLPVSDFQGLDLLHCWLGVSLDEKLRSTLGTIRRILVRKLYRPLKLDLHDGIRLNQRSAAAGSESSKR
jgi:coenzyme F420 hydrogenase subunit beta